MADKNVKYKMLIPDSDTRKVSVSGLLNCLKRPLGLTLIVVLIIAGVVVISILHGPKVVTVFRQVACTKERTQAEYNNITKLKCPTLPPTKSPTVTKIPSLSKSTCQKLLAPKKKCRVIDLSKPSKEKNECITTKTKPPYKACIYDPRADAIVSRYLKNTGMWEAPYIPTFQAILNRDKGLGFLDFGANIAPWGLLAAAMGHKTVAVEPYTPHVKLIHKSVKVNKFEDRFVLVENAISDTYSNFTAYFAYGGGNQGALRMVPFKGQGVQMHSVLMDDLLEVITFNRALLKIDVEGFEDKAFAKSDKFFQKIFVPYILMEWAFPLYVYTNDPKRVMGLINMIKAKGYLPFSYQMQPLDVKNWRHWPNDLIWKHNLVGKV